jgi:hypothetical protein
LSASLDSHMKSRAMVDTGVLIQQAPRLCRKFPSGVVDAADVCVVRGAVRYMVSRQTSCFLPSVVLVATAALASSGCRIATEYVPQTPGRATLGMEDDKIGVYKNGKLTLLTDDIQRTFECSAHAAGTASAAAARARSYRINGWIGLGGFDLILLSPLVGVAAVSIAVAGLGAGVYGVFGVRAINAQRASLALAIDAINLHNDTAECLGSTPPAAGVPQ